jgi:Tol biopolymer transport system component
VSSYHRARSIDHGGFVMKRSVIAAASLMVTLTVLAATGSTAAAIGTENGKILFRRYLNDDHTTGDIFSIRPDGTGLFRVTRSGSNQVGTEPNPSPDGHWIAYMIAPENDLEHGRLFKIHPNGEGRTALSASCTGTCQGDGFPNWAPSGQLIAFQRLVSTDPSQGVGVSAIFVMEPDGTDVQQITLRSADPSQFNSLGDEAPSWAPDGSRLAFERFSEARQHQAIFTVRLDGTGLERITPWRLDASQPYYSPDGRWIVFRSNESSDIEGNVWLVGPTGDGLHAVTHTRAGEGKWQSCAFSPDGRYLVSALTPIVDGEQQNADVYVMKVDGSGLRNVTKTPEFWESAPDWATRPPD